MSAVADEAANLIGEFDEGFSNRQTWHNAALAAIAVWFEDEELAGRAVEGPTGLLAHLVRGFGDDGMWYEGENYHLFALRGQLLAMGWARQAGVDLLADRRLAGRLAAALRAPALTALPDLTFPARKDSRFGVSLAQPMYLELWEVGARAAGRRRSRSLGLARARSTPRPRRRRSGSIPTCTRPASRPPSTARARRPLLVGAARDGAGAAGTGRAAVAAGNTLLESQGLADPARAAIATPASSAAPTAAATATPTDCISRCTPSGVHWLPDPGTGSYVARDLFWYRSTLAHNAPRLDGALPAAGRRATARPSTSRETGPGPAAGSAS